MAYIDQPKFYIFVLFCVLGWVLWGFFLFCLVWLWLLFYLVFPVINRFCCCNKYLFRGMYKCSLFVTQENFSQNILPFLGKRCPLSYRVIFFSMVALDHIGFYYSTHHLLKPCAKVWTPWDLCFLKGIVTRAIYPSVLVRPTVTPGSQWCSMTNVCFILTQNPK